MARDSMVEEPSNGMARTAEAEASNLGSLPGALPGADSLLGVAPSIDLLSVRARSARRKFWLKTKFHKVPLERMAFWGAVKC